MKRRHEKVLLVAAMTGGGSATPVVVSSLSAAQAAVNSYSGSGGLVLHYNGAFDEAPILANICGQWSKPAQELSISGKNDITVVGLDGSCANFGILIEGSSSRPVRTWQTSIRSKSSDRVREELACEER